MFHLINSLRHMQPSGTLSNKTSTWLQTSLMGKAQKLHLMYRLDFSARSKILCD